MLKCLEETKTFLYFLSFLFLFVQKVMILPHESKSLLSNIVNTMAADDLARQGARSSSAMVLTRFSLDIPISAPDEKG